MTANVAIVNSGGANIASLIVALKRLGQNAVLTTDPALLQSASHVILPGVGAAQDAMQRLADKHLVTCLQQLTQPVLGICLGMQLLGEGSAEDNAKCLGLTTDHADLLKQDEHHAVPHMGWNQLVDVKTCPLLTDITAGSYFYFIHSYALPVSSTTQATCHYQTPFAAVIQRDNFFGTQFHPERSAKAGRRLLSNFLAL
ncbi:MAG: imidazole glycerol phosphate synthase subunit HisH [Woeseiaceae bacterium]